jgi:hypothetical protein
MIEERHDVALGKVTVNRAVVEVSLSNHLVPLIFQEPESIYIVHRQRQLAQRLPLKKLRRPRIAARQTGDPTYIPQHDYRRDSTAVRRLAHEFPTCCKYDRMEPMRQAIEE